MIVTTRSIAQSLYRRALATLLVASLASPAFHPAPASAVEETTFTFNGGGWGHGIGLSQWGARGYANAGWSHSKILAHYYQGTRLETKPSATVRVNLDKNKSSRSEWRIQSASDTSLTVYQTSDSKVSVTLSPDKTWWITTSDSNTRVHKSEPYYVKNSDGSTTKKYRPGAIVKKFDGSCIAKAGTSVRLISASGPFDYTRIRWRGKLRFVPSSVSPTKSSCVNHVNIEDYLRGVVPRESPSSWPAEALKAQAVAARSYAYEDAAKDRTIWCTTMSQVYNGRSRPGYRHETDATDAAIAATKGQVVMYGSEDWPVQTFFFSASGGHTADIEDVWMGATPRPYYKGVPDRDEASPHYTWSSGPYSASTLSSKARSKFGSSASAPYPHTIKDIDLERADSGFTRYATLTWTNGASYRVKGDSVRSMLGLRSSKYSVSINRPGPTVNSYQQTDSKLAWGGVWTAHKASDVSGGTYAKTKVPRSQVVVRFKGTGVAWYGTRASSLGKAQVEIDGVTVGTADSYASSRRTKQKIFSKTGLPYGVHTLRITAKSSRNAASSGYGMVVDRVTVTSGSLLQAAQPVRAYQEWGPRVAEFGRWSTVKTAEASNGSHILNARAGSSLLVDFIGTRIDWVGTKAPGYGTARVSVDGGTPVTVSLDADSPAYRKIVFSRAGLAPNKVHRLLIQTVGPSGDSSGTVSADYFRVTGGWVEPPRLAVLTFQERAASTSGDWDTLTNSAASGDRHIVSDEKNAKATVRFEGTSVAWYGARTKRYGKAEVLLDGERVAIVDTYSSTTKLNQKLWSRSGLPAKGHTLTIRVLGTKRSSSLGANVSVDRFRIAGRLAP